MPLYFNVGLPGPFTYSKRVNTKGTKGAFYWLFIGFWWVPTKWALVAVITLMIYTCRLLGRGALWLCRELAARLFPERYR